MANETRKYLDETGLGIVWGKITAVLGLKAPIASPTFTGTPRSVTPTAGDNSEKIATTAFVKTVVDDYAPKASPALTGTPTAPTATAGTNTTQIATTAFVKSAVDTAIGSITGISFEKVNSYADLPATGAAGTIYLVPNSGSAPNIYDEYIWVLISGSTYGYEKIGTTDIDLSDYWSKTELVALTEAEINSICT